MIGVVLGADMCSYIGCLGGAGVGRQMSARGKGWHGSGGARELANAKKSDHAIAFLAARPVGWGFRLGIGGDRAWIVAYVCVWCREGARETNGWETNDPAHKVRWGGDVVGGTGE